MTMILTPINDPAIKYSVDNVKIQTTVERGAIDGLKGWKGSFHSKYKSLLEKHQGKYSCKFGTIFIVEVNHKNKKHIYNFIGNSSLKEVEGGSV